MIDVGGKPRIEVSQRIVGQRSQMDHGVEASEIDDFQRSHVLDQGANLFPPRPEGGATIEVSIDPGDLMASADEEGRHHRPDVTAASGEEDFHAWSDLGEM